VLERPQNDEEPKGEGRRREHQVDRERVGDQAAASGRVVVGRRVGTLSPVLEKLNVDFEQDQEDQQTAGEGELELFMSLVAIAVFDRVKTEGKSDQNEDHSDDDQVEHERSPPRQEPVDRKALLHRGPLRFSARLQERGRASRSPSSSSPSSSSSSSSSARIDDTVWLPLNSNIEIWVNAGLLCFIFRGRTDADVARRDDCRGQSEHACQDREDI
jgi:hypothetical protein